MRTAMASGSRGRRWCTRFPLFVGWGGEGARLEREPGDGDINPSTKGGHLPSGLATMLQNVRKHVTGPAVPRSRARGQGTQVGAR